jgi:hypothetical protein
MTTILSGGLRANAKNILTLNRPPWPRFTLNPHSEKTINPLSLSLPLRCSGDMRSAEFGFVKFEVSFIFFHVLFNFFFL